jgi:integrase
MFRRADSSVFQFVEAYDLERGLTKEAARQYRYAAKSVSDWAKRPVGVHELEPDLFNRWLRDIQSSHLAPNTVANRRRHLLALWRAAADKGLCQEPPRRLRPAKVPYTPPRAWTVEEVRQLLAVASKLKRTRKGNVPRNVWWSLAVRISWETGLRLVDILRLRCDEVQPDGVMALGQSKTGRAIVCRLTPATVEMLRESLVAHPRKMICPWAKSAETFRSQFKRIVAKAGVRNGSWKWIRRASATDVEKGCPGAGAVHLGHAPGSAIAARHYLDPYIIGAPRTAPTSLD